MNRFCVCATLALSASILGCGEAGPEPPETIFASTGGWTMDDLRPPGMTDVRRVKREETIVASGKAPAGTKEAQIGVYELWEDGKFWNVVSFAPAKISGTSWKADVEISWATASGPTLLRVTPGQPEAMIRVQPEDPGASERIEVLEPDDASTVR